MFMLNKTHKRELEEAKRKLVKENFDLENLAYRQSRGSLKGGYFGYCRKSYKSLYEEIKPKAELKNWDSKELEDELMIREIEENGVLPVDGVIHYATNINRDNKTISTTYSIDGDVKTATIPFDMVEFYA